MTEHRTYPVHQKFVSNSNLRGIINTLGDRSQDSKGLKELE